MPVMKPITELSDYAAVLDEVHDGSPVYLTKNGRGMYAIVSIEEHERTKAALALMCELEKGRRSGEEKGWSSLTEVRTHLGQQNG